MPFPWLLQFMCSSHLLMKPIHLIMKPRDNPKESQNAQTYDVPKNPGVPNQPSGISG